MQAGDPKRIALYEVDQPWQREALEAELAGSDLRVSPEPLTPETAAMADGAEVVSVFIRSPVGAAVLQRLPALRLVVTRSTGYDHMNVEACAQRGIVVSNVPSYGENTVAEHTFGLILNLSRKIHQAYGRTRSCDFSLEGLEGFDLRGKTLGVIGAGSIGLHVIRIARAFGMSVLAHDVAPQPLLADVLAFRYVAIEDLLGDSHVVTLHVPLRPGTRHLMNRTRFAGMRRGALLVNTSRGAVVDTEALVWALDAGILAGAGLDVIEGEELLAEERHLARTPAEVDQLRDLLCDHLLLARDNVIITPHMAWYSRDALRRILGATAEAIRSFLAGRPVHVVTPAPVR